MEFNPEPFLISVDKAIGVRTVPIHLPKVLRQPAITHQNRYLMKRFRRKTPEIPGGGSPSHIRFRFALLRVNKVRKFEWIPDEKNGCVVSDDIPVSFVGVEF